MLRRWSCRCVGAIICILCLYVWHERHCILRWLAAKNCGINIKASLWYISLNTLVWRSLKLVPFLLRGLILCTFSLILKVTLACQTRSGFFLLRFCELHYDGWFNRIWVDLSRRWLPFRLHLTFYFLNDQFHFHLLLQSLLFFLLALRYYNFIFKGGRHWNK